MSEYDFEDEDIVGFVKFDWLEQEAARGRERATRLKLDELTARLTKLAQKAEAIGHDARPAALLAMALALGDDGVTALCRRIVAAAQRQAERDATAARSP